MRKFRVAPPLTVTEIESIAGEVRAALGVGPGSRAPMAVILEHVLPDLISGYEFRVDDARALGRAEAITDGFRPIITFGASAYNELAKDAPRARMTAAHELGHLLLHTGQTGFALLRTRDTRLDPEKQADVFAAAFLMPASEFKAVKSIHEAMRKFGVSKDAALFRARKLKLWHLLGGHRDRTLNKKKGHDMRRAP